MRVWFGRRLHPVVCAVESLLKEKGCSMVVSPLARQWLATEGYNPAYGARPLKRIIHVRNHAMGAAAVVAAGCATLPLCGTLMRFPHACGCGWCSPSVVTSQRVVLNPLSKHFLAGNLRDGQQVHVTVEPVDETSSSTLPERMDTSNVHQYRIAIEVEGESATEAVAAITAGSVADSTSGQSPHRLAAPGDDSDGPETQPE